MINKAKRDNGKVLDDVDLAILDILNYDAPVISDYLDPPDTVSDCCADIEQVFATTAPEVKLFKVERPETPSSGDADIAVDAYNATTALPVVSSMRPKCSQTSGLDYESKEKRLRLELLEVDIYHRKLQCLKLERELNLERSKFTENITDKGK